MESDALRPPVLQRKDETDARVHDENECVFTLGNQRRDPLPLWLCWVVVLAFAAVGMWLAYAAFRKSQ